MGIPVRAQLIMGIFQKALKMKDSKDQKKSPDPNAAPNGPDALNLISSDTLSFSKFTAINYIIPSSFVKFFFAVLFLLKLLGWQSTLIGMVVTVVSVPIHIFIINQQRTAQGNLTAARDKKTKAITEALHALRQIKFSALETQWEEHFEALRQEEIKHLRWSFTVRNIRSVWGVAAPFIVAAGSICAYARLQRALTPSIIFPMIEVLPHLQETLGFVPVVFQDYFGARSNATRMDEFLRRPEQKNILGPSPSGRILFQEASIAWPSDEVESEVGRKKQAILSHRFSLNSVNLDFPFGELSVISGKTGSGKSLLLAAIIGEVELLSGRIEAPSTDHGYRVAFVSQTPWLQNTTIKDNILFGAPFDEKRYKKVIAACALQPDLTALVKGDETHIGLGGVRLSGGQRARVAFGRALYSSAQLLVLDDIFSALDSHVSKDIFNALTGELGNGRTRILVTHHVSLCFPKTAYIVHVKNNTVAYAGDPASIDKGVNVIEAEVYLRPKSPTEEKSIADARPKAPKTSPTANKSKAVKARSDLKMYNAYFAAAGGLGFTLIYLLSLISKQLLNALTTWLLGRINSTRPKIVVNQSVTTSLAITDVGNGLQQYIYMYLLSSLLAIILESIFNLHNFSGSIRASKTLFREITFRVIRMPLLWIDSTPIGEMLKRFTADTRIVDDLVLVTVSEFADCLVKLKIVIGVG
jgi:ABC-type multidrug transport system fused ATPase/permease subunit